METFLFPIIALVVGAIMGFFGGKSSATNRAAEIEAEASKSAKQVLAAAEEKAERLVEKFEKKNEEIKQRKIRENKERVAKARKEAESIRREALTEAKQKEAEVRKLESGFKGQQDKIRSEKKALEREREEFKSEQRVVAEERKTIDRQKGILSEKEAELAQKSEAHIQALEKVANLSADDAKKELMTAIREKADVDALAYQKEVIENAKITAKAEAKKIVIQTIQRQCAETTIENTVSVFKIDSDDIKGQIIGREGRNIKTLESATGAELVVDDTPGVIMISSFDPVRRELCRLSLKQLVADRRIQPQRIEEVVKKTRKELEARIAEIGERTIIKLGINGLDPYLVKMVGRMRFRSSYGQNLLRHSIETANLCATMAAELGLNRKQAQLAKRAGLLHDIGKVVENETDLTHALIGAELCKKHGENEVVCNAVGAHHDEMPMTNILSPIIQACDAISGARPGARREILDSYLERLGDLEQLAMKHKGVDKAYAMQAGRELRVIVEAEKVSDEQADDISFQISQKIQDEMQYPGQIKVMVIREKRAVTFAR